MAMESSRETRPVTEEYCLTAGCVKAAAVVINMYDNSVDPCQDFYKFSCGTFLKETVIPDHKTNVGAFSVVRDVLNQRLRNLFEGEAVPGEPRIFADVRNYYKSCMNEDLIAESSKGDLLKLVTQLGGWPVLEGDKWEGDKFVWQKTEEEANRLGLDTGKLLNVGIGTNNANSSQRIMSIDHASLGLSREYLIKGLEDKAVAAYAKYMIDIAVYLGADPDKAKEELTKSFEFELQLAQINMPKELRRNKTALNNPMTVKEMSKLYEGYDWVDHINQALNNQDVTVDENEIVNVKTPAFLKKLKALLEETDKRVVANYLVWRYVKSMVNYMGKDALAIRQDYNKVLSGQDKESPRWETCVKTVAGIGSSYLYFYEGSLTNAVGSMYAQTYFPADKKDLADEMVVNIREEFRLMLEELDWMDEATKAAALAKAASMRPHIAYAKEILDTELMNEFYTGLAMNSDSFLSNNLRLKKFILDYYSQEFRRPIDKHSWKTHGGAGIVNAFYSPNENSIQFPAGILDGLFFQADRPAYMNYGAIGMVVGHEITHGFDDQGAQRDGEGNLVNWWAKQTKQNYLNKAQCIIDQYGNFTVDVGEEEELNLNGINTQGENIADNGGYKEAFRAYNRLVSQHGPEPRLPGLPYTQRQMFWLAGAQIWCNTMRPETLKRRVLTDGHSPGEFRVNGPYSNLPEFAADWNCPAGSPMNPAKRCSVW